MFRALSEKLTTFVVGELVHTYEPIEVTHGPITCSDRCELRNRKGVAKLIHRRVWRDGHTLKKTYEQYTPEDVAALQGVFAEALGRIALQQSHDFGPVTERRDGRMQTRASFFIEPSGGEHYLFQTTESKSYSSSSSVTTYFPLDEVRAMTAVLTDAQGRMDR